MPWTPDTLRPLFAELVPLVESGSIESLKDAAAKVSPAAVALVEKRAPWNPVARQTLVSAGSQCAAKWLNHFGVSADNAPEIALAIAVASIWYGHSAIKRELAKMAKAVTPAKESEPGASQERRAEDSVALPKE